MGESLRAPFLGESDAKDLPHGTKGSLTYCSGDPLGKSFWVESKKLWKVAGPAIFSRLATYGMNVITQAFAGHLGDLELAAISISSTVVVGLNFGFMKQYDGHCTSIHCSPTMDKHVYRPVPTKATSHSFIGILSQDTNEDLYDDIFDVDNMSAGSPQFHPSSHVNSEGHMPNEVALQSNPTDVLPQHRGRVRWSVLDTIILIDAKRIEKDLLSSGGVMKKTQSATERWKVVEKYCHGNGVARPVNQCRDWWEHILPEYKKVRDYEHNIPSRHITYWAMTTKERLDNKLPTNCIEEFFWAIDNSFEHDRLINPGNITVNTSSTMPATSKETPLSNPNVQAFDSTSQDRNLTDTSYVTGTQSTGKRHRSMLKTAGLKDAMIENTKIIVSSLGLAEEGRMKRHSMDMESRVFYRKHQLSHIQVLIIFCKNDVP